MKPSNLLSPILFLILTSWASPALAESDIHKPLQESLSNYNLGNTKAAIANLETLLKVPNLTVDQKIEIQGMLLHLYKQTGNYFKLGNGVTEVGKIFKSLKAINLNGKMMGGDNFEKDYSKYYLSYIYYISVGMLWDKNKQGAIDLLILATNSIEISKLTVNEHVRLRAYLSSLYHQMGQPEKRDKEIYDAIILAGQSKGLSPDQSFWILMDIIEYLNSTGRIAYANQIINVMNRSVIAGHQYSLTRFHWDLLKSRVQVEKGLLRQCYDTLETVNAYITPGLLVPLYFQLRVNYLKGVCGYLSGTNKNLELNIEKINKIDPQNFFPNYNYTTKVMFQYLMGKEIPARSMGDYGNSNLEDSDTAYLLNILETLSIIKNYKYNKAEKKAKHIIRDLIKRHLEFLNQKIPLSIHGKFNFDWSYIYVLMEMLELLLEFSLNKEDESLLFEAQQYINHKDDNIGPILRHAIEEAKTDIEKADFRSFERFSFHFHNLLKSSVSNIVAGFFKPDASSQEIIVNKKMLSFYLSFNDILKSFSDKRIKLDKVVKAGKSFPALKLIQGQLKPGEVIVMPNFVKGKIFVSCVSRSQFIFRQTEHPKNELISKMNKILERLSAENVSAMSDRKEFSFDESYSIYNMVFNPISSCLENQKHIVVIPDPLLLSLPYNTLITQPFSPGLNSKEFSSAPWLIKKYSISLNPSIKSFYMVRRMADLAPAELDFIGFGNATFDNVETQTLDLEENEYFLRGINSFGSIKGLPPLPEAEEEIKNIANLFPSTKVKVYLGKDATEMNVRRANLYDYKVISFATHSLMGGESEITNEPALILYPGNVIFSYDDGILTSREISSLKLNANLVILSACNTFSSDGSPEGSKLSGLADSFFFAGSKSLAITQWPVYSKMSQIITQKMVESSLRESSGIAESLRVTMLDLINNPPEGFNAHPKYWAPFIIAGNGQQLINSDKYQNTNSQLNIEWVNKLGSDMEGTQVTYDDSQSIFFILGGYRSKLDESKNITSIIKKVDSSGNLIKLKEFDSSNGGYYLSKVFENKIALVTSLKSEKFFKIKLYLLNNNLDILWEYLIETKSETFPIGVVGDDKYLYLAAKDLDYREIELDKEGARYAFSIYKFDENGNLVSSSKIYPKDKINNYLKSTQVKSFSSLVTHENQIIIAINYNNLINNTNQSSISGSCGLIVSSLITINKDYLTSNQKEYFKDSVYYSIKIAPDNSIFLAGAIYTKRCGIYSDLSIIRGNIDSGFKNFFSSNSPLMQTANNLAFYKDKVIVGGSAEIRFHPSLDMELMGRLKGDQFRHVSGTQMQGWLLLLDSKGKLLGDKIIFDNRKSNIFGLDVNNNGQVIATGVINGTQMLEMGFSLN